jgi:osomolarity two-component system sensor histidine kinase SLN1
MPPSLYPNLTYTGLSGIHDGEPKGIGNTFVQAFTDVDLKSPLLLGPLRVNSSFAMVSLTLPIINQTSHIDVMGYMTILAQASALYNIQKSREGLDLTGEVLILRPSEPQNKFPPPERPSSQGHTANRTLLESADVLFMFPLDPTPGQADRHSFHNFSNFSETFPLSSYPAALDAFSNMNPNLNNASSDLSTTNEQGQQVAVGYARPQTKLVDWVLIVEQTKAEAFGPVVQLRRILLGCVFGTLGLILLLVVPMAHWSVKPITRLKEATEKSIQPPGYSPKGSIRSQNLLGPSDGSVDEETGEDHISTHQSKCSTGIFVRMRRLGRRQKSKAELNEDARRRVFKIPGKVIDRKHYITDELTELTSTFNEMSDELMMQYSKLEERVAERTRELEVSKKAAEAANESKTLFIANISHELKTPLNGILGMCAVCMGEDDLSQIKRSLQVVYKSGDLLLHLLNDLLTFSKNQIGQSISIEEKEFGLSDIKSQVVTIFDKQVEEGNINLAVNFIGTGEAELGVDKDKVFKKPLTALGPNGTGRLKDMRLWGDQHRILQVLINLVGNSLKFTPQGGKVEVRIRCIGEKETSSNDGRKDSMGSKHGSMSRSSRNRHRVGSDSNAPAASRLSSSSSKPVGTALLINPMDPKASTTHIQGRERSPTPPPANARTLIFEFEVEDTGPGIPANLQERVFEPFVQGDLGLNRKYGGTGLGLSICSQLAGLMGGTITLESSEGQGSIFSMRIPLKFVGERVSSTASSSVAGGSRPPSVTSRDDARPTKLSVGLLTPTVSVNNGQAMGFEKDMQPRLVGLSQPFFSAPSSAEANTDKQLAAFDRVAAPKRDSGKIRVLVAEDNLVNQEVVLRYGSRCFALEGFYD